MTPEEHKAICALLGGSPVKQIGETRERYLARIRYGGSNFGPAIATYKYVDVETLEMVKVRTELDIEKPLDTTVLIEDGDWK